MLTNDDALIPIFYSCYCIIFLSYQCDISIYQNFFIVIDLILLYYMFIFSAQIKLHQPLY